MEFRGTVKDGVVILEKRARLKDGLKVKVRPIAATAAKRKRKAAKTLLERLAPVVGIARGLPADLALNHDHYLHGQPKKK